MKLSNHNVMVDLETMGNSANSAITAIGAVRFNSDGIQDGFYTIVDLGSCLEVGLELDASTVLWWLQQSDEARAEFSKPGTPLYTALTDFGNWLADENVVIWGNGAAFDNVILANAYRKYNLPTPWKFWNDACYRTVKGMYPHVKLQRSGTHHNALDDAKTQAEHLLAIYNSLNRV